MSRPKVKMSRPRSAATNTFGVTAASDGIVMGRLHRRRDVPFGKSFSYTDALDLPGQFDSHKPWYRKLIQRFGRRPLGWIVVEAEKFGMGRLPQAYLGEKEVRVSPIEVTRLVTVYDPNVILAMDAYEKEHEGEG